jgi:Flp pilus assembly pilin Flp
MTKFSAFLKDEAGAVTVDWVVLTAGVVVFGLMVYNVITPAVDTLAHNIEHELGDAQTCMTSGNLTC